MGMVVNRLKDILGPDIVGGPDSFGGRRLEDWSGIPAGSPIGIIRPRSTKQVSQALAVCHGHKQPIAVQGGLTGLAGAACPRDGEILLSLERMNKIVELDEVSGTMTVQAGAILQNVQEQSAEAGYYFPLDLGARGSCMIGGVMATNAGGNRVIKYGMMREQVLGLEAVLADGKVVGGLHKMIKNNTGYDLRNLLIGSEGTLGVITGAVLRLRPRPAGISTAWCGLGDFTAVTSLLRQAQSGLAGGVSAFEVMWPSYYEFVLAKIAGLRRPLAGEHRFHVLLESDGGDADRFEAFLGRMLERHVIEDAALAMSEADALAFWAVRDAPGEFKSLMPDLIAFDVSFAVRDLGLAADMIAAALSGARVLTYGHLGDGNIHLIVDSAADPADIEKRVYAVVAELGGSVSAEHGIGRKKRELLGITRTADELAAMAAVKAALDPHGILNPGRIL